MLLNMMKMSNLDHISSVLHNDFLSNERSALEEKSAKMKININSSGCRFILYKYDKDLKRDYKGGLFPFFAKIKNVCCICDYILFAEFKNKLFVLIIELKKGKEPTLPQLKAAKNFVDYIINTINRVNGISIEPEIRLISIHEYKMPKRSIKDRGISYDDDRHCQFNQSIFEIRKFLV